MLRQHYGLPSFRELLQRSCSIFWFGPSLVSVPSTIRASQSHLRCHILPQLGRLRLDQIGREQQQIFVSKLSQIASRKTVLNVLGTLSTVLCTAKKWGYISELVHVEDLALPDSGPQVEARFFTPDQVRQIIGLAEEPFRTMFAVLALTAMRAGELLALTVDDLDFDRRIIQVRPRRIAADCGGESGRDFAPKCAQIGRVGGVDSIR